MKNKTALSIVVCVLILLTLAAFIVGVMNNIIWPAVTMFIVVQVLRVFWEDFR